MCNKEIKFKVLYNWARKQGFDYIATGHYAQIKKNKIKQGSGGGASRNNSVIPANLSVIPAKAGIQTLNQVQDDKGNDYEYQLVRSRDEFKDQTYFIYNIKPAQLPHLLFPIGLMKKSEVRALAKKLHLPNAAKKESMGLCFVGQIRLKDFFAAKVESQDWRNCEHGWRKNRRASWISFLYYWPASRN